MRTFTLDDLWALLRTAVGETGESRFGEDDQDTPFADLGCDSLVMLDVAARVEQQYDIPVPDDTVGRMTTPRVTVELIEGLRSGVAS